MLDASATVAKSASVAFTTQRSGELALTAARHPTRGGRYPVLGLAVRTHDDLLHGVLDARAHAAALSSGVGPFEGYDGGFTVHGVDRHRSTVCQFTSQESAQATLVSTSRIKTRSTFKPTPVTKSCPAPVHHTHRAPGPRRAPTEVAFPGRTEATPWIPGAKRGPIMDLPMVSTRLLRLNGWEPTFVEPVLACGV
jgi:hypothetical protein